MSTFPSGTIIIDEVCKIVGDAEEYYEELVRRSYSIGGMIIFPKHII